MSDFSIKKMPFEELILRGIDFLVYSDEKEILHKMKIEDICRFTKCKNIFDFENEYNIKVRTLALDF